MDVSFAWHSTFLQRFSGNKFILKLHEMETWQTQKKSENTWEVCDKNLKVKLLRLLCLMIVEGL